jgi:DNA topoisomerase IA
VDCAFVQAGKEVLNDDGYTGELFTASGKRVLTPGFTEVMEHLAIMDEQLPEFSEGEEVQQFQIGFCHVTSQYPT